MAYYDLQVNGYGGIDFNGDDLTDESLLQACQRLRNDEVEGILATVITDTIPAMQRRLSRLADIRNRESLVSDVLAGVHIEGPFLNEQPGYIGAHPASAARPADIDSMQRLLDAAEGLTRIVTLAPERDPDMAVTRMLTTQGVVVSAGHCNPSLAELQSAIDAGLSMFTHLGNGCPLNMHRHDNVIQRVLNCADKLWIGFIADGVHVPLVALRNYLKCAGLDRCFVVTDAISAAGLGPGEFRLGDQTVIVDENLATWAPDRSHLMGSAGTMARSAQNLQSELRLSAAEIRRLTYDNPRRAIGVV